MGDFLVKNQLNQKLDYEELATKELIIKIDNNEMNDINFYEIM